MKRMIYIILLLLLVLNINCILKIESYKTSYSTLKIELESQKSIHKEEYNSLIDKDKLTYLNHNFKILKPVILYNEKNKENE